MRNIEVLKKLARNGRTFTVKDASKILAVEEDTLKKILYRMETRGWIERIEKGKYMIIPLEAEKGRYTLNEFVMASLLVKPYAIAYWSALHHHGLTEQISSTVFVQTTGRKKRQKIEVFGVRYMIIKIKKEKFFGTEKAWIDESEVIITDVEKTVVDCLDKPQYCGGIIEVCKALRKRNFDAKKLSDYALRMRNTGVIRRLGYLSDMFGIEVMLPKSDMRNYLLLDPSMPKKGKRSAKWRLIINLDEREMEETE